MQPTILVLAWLGLGKIINKPTNTALNCLSVTRIKGLA